MRNLEDRRFVLMAIFLLIALIFLSRLFYIQVIDDSYKLSARNQTLRYVTQYASRGLIYDRNSNLLAYNEVAFDLMVVPKQVKAMDTLAFCELIDITKEQFDTKFAKAKKYSRYKASVFQKQITAKEFVPISEKLYQFPGFYGQQRSIRKYPKNICAHVLGYISEVTNTDIERDEYYKPGDYLGTNGLEKTYETELRGTRGTKILMVDKYNTVQGSFMNGEYDSIAVPGQNLFTTIDQSLQEYGELLMQNKKGSIVAIEPQTGEILALVSAPSFNPNMLVSRKRGEYYKELASNDSLNPLFNRALMSLYPPGSIFKIVQSLIGLQEGVLKPNTSIACNKIIGCHNHPAPNTLQKAIQFSCNPYYYYGVKRIIMQGKSNSIFEDSRIGLNNWKTHMESFGLGVKLPLDVEGLKSGNIPNAEYYDKIYGKLSWAYSTIYSISIGQGEVELVPLQMANLAAIIANKGYYYYPHLVKGIGESGAKREIYKQRNNTTVDSSYFNLIHDAMQAVIEEAGGTARKAKVPGVTVCGKTGTVENPHGEDHSVFMAFAPRENPKIALAVYIENAGFGGTWAAPLSSLLIEKYLTGNISDKEKEERVLNANFIIPQENEEAN